jgi:hypothetical protein
MRKSEYTPGPWVAYETGERWFVGAAANDTGPIIQLCGRYACESNDAHLAAAAPDLLEAAQWAVDLLQLDFDDYPATEKCRAAIAKALGTT